MYVTLRLKTSTWPGAAKGHYLSNAWWFSKINKVQARHQQQQSRAVYFTFFVHSCINHSE